MKKIISAFSFFFLLASCTMQNAFSDFDYSYTKHGGYNGGYENLLIKDHKALYAVESQGKKNNKKFKISDADLHNIEKVLKENQFRNILEDRKKIYDRASVRITIKNGENAGSKSDESLIMSVDQRKWENIVEVFQKIIDHNANNAE